MSPEVLRGDGYDFKSDIWSLGCLLYELTMLKSPFKAEGLNLYSLFQKISQGDYQPLPTSYSDELRSLAYLMISTRSEDRPEIAAACIKASALRLSTSNSRKPSLDLLIPEIVDDRNLKGPGSDRIRDEENISHGNEGGKAFIKENRVRISNSDTNKVAEEKEMDRVRDRDRDRDRDREGDREGEEKRGYEKVMRSNDSTKDGVFEADKNIDIDMKTHYDSGLNNHKKNNTSHSVQSSNLNSVHKHEKNTSNTIKRTENSESLNSLYINPNIRPKIGQSETQDAPDTDSTGSSHIHTNTNSNTNRDRNRDRQNSGQGNGNSKIRNFSPNNTTENNGKRPVIERNKGFDLADDVNPVLYSCLSYARTHFIVCIIYDKDTFILIFIFMPFF
jgi:serine/threonine protein kinase